MAAKKPVNKAKTIITSRKVILATVSIALIFGVLNMQTDKVLALTDKERYDTGYGWGCSDARKGGHPYLKSHPSHTAIFMKGYNNGYASCSSGNGQSPSTSTAVNRNNMFSDLNMCQAVKNYLVHSCNTYVKSNGLLTDEGKRAKSCITNGIILSYIGLAIHIPPLSIIDRLKPLSESTGCGGIINWPFVERDVETANAFLLFLGILTG